MSYVSHHPSSVVQVEIVGIEEHNRGRSCEVHQCCGKVIAWDMVLRLRKVQILNDKNYEETAIAAYWITDGVDRCCMGFLPRHCVCRASYFDGRIVQVVSLLAQSENSSERQHSRRNRGVAYACIIDSETERITTRLNEQTRPAASIHALAASILAAGSSESDNDEEKEYAKTEEYSKRSGDDK